jgi:hypothetical protein
MVADTVKARCSLSQPFNTLVSLLFIVLSPFFTTAVYRITVKNRCMLSQPFNPGVSLLFAILSICFRVCLCYPACRAVSNCSGLRRSGHEQPLLISAIFCVHGKRILTVSKVSQSERPRSIGRPVRYIQSIQRLESKISFLRVLILTTLT